MRYVDGYVLPVPKKNLKAYARMARMGAEMWMKHGALDFKEQLHQGTATYVQLALSLTQYLFVSRVKAHTAASGIFAVS